MNRQQNVWSLLGFLLLFTVGLQATSISDCATLLQMKDFLGRLDSLPIGELESLSGHRAPNELVGGLRRNFFLSKVGQKSLDQIEKLIKEHVLRMAQNAHVLLDNDREEAIVEFQRMLLWNNWYMPPVVRAADQWSYELVRLLDFARLLTEEQVMALDVLMREAGFFGVAATSEDVRTWDGRLAAVGIPPFITIQHLDRLKFKLGQRAAVVFCCRMCCSYCPSGYGQVIRTRGCR